LGWHSSNYTALDLPNPTIFSSCGAEAFHAVACVDEDFRHGRSSVLRIPTSGATAMSTATVGPVLDVALTATRTGWVGPVNPGSRVHLFTAPAKATGKVTTSGYPLYPGYAAAVLFDEFLFSPLHVLTSAFGRFAIAASPADKPHVATTVAASSTPRTILPASPATVHASAVSISGRTVSYADDRHRYNGDDVFSRTLGRTPRARPGGAREVISTAGTSLALDSSPSTIASTSVVGTGATAHFVTLVVDGHRRTTLEGPAKPDQAVRLSSLPLISVSGHRVLFTRGLQGTAWILNAANGRSRPAPVPAHAPVALTGARVAFQKPDGSVWSRPLAGGESVKLFAAPKRLIDVNAQLTAAGGFVAAEYDDDPEDDPVPGPFVRYRHINGKGPIRTLSTGGVLGSNDEGLMFDSVDDRNFPVEAVTTQLRPWTSGRVRDLLTQTYNFNNSVTFVRTGGQVSLSHHRIAWIDPRGRVHAGTWH
jgi:hypothetical protein